MSVVIRSAAPGDEALVLSLVRELAAYEELAHQVEATEAGLAEALFEGAPRVFCDIAEKDGAPAGFALWFYTFSTFRGRHGIYLEDVFVRPPFRGLGIGRALLERLAARCVAEGLGRFEWSVLNWNAPSIAFYKSLGAVAMDGWTMYRMDGDALARLGTGAASRAGRRAGDEDGTK
ncbi:GNAT family N-acetyltransferase [Chelatococcus sambhunathii]|uniref:GNAT family N-acetyltransferase n=1 Tax=Chelatococcus sambhunathii TaxID=363953 RepID=A0ABU1DBU4_9HYPH|nr:GNAT family N-acetyltransferase [Chelatococcus sambhunathii]MDR4305573.1 GNAT family N-acetyltransferase [Chelatococcus sambhunathii]